MSITIPLATEHTPIVMAAAPSDPFFSQDASSLGLMNLEMTAVDELGAWEECSLTETACVQSMVDSEQGQELWQAFHSYVADHRNVNMADETNIADLAIHAEAPTMEAALGMSPMKPGKEMDLRKIAAYTAMVQLFPWEEAFYAIEDAAALAQEMGKRGYKIFRKRSGQAIGFMKPKLQNMAARVKKHAQQGWVKIRPVIQPLPGKVVDFTKNTANFVGPRIGKLAHQTETAAKKHVPKLLDATKKLNEEHIQPKIVKPTGDFIKKTATQVKNITVEHVWPKMIKPSADFVMSGAAFQAVMDGFKKLHQAMPWTKSADDDYMYYDFYEIKVDKEEDLFN